MGDIYPPTGRDPSAIFYNPAYLANCDSIRLSLDNINGPINPKNNLALSVGDLGIASSSMDIGNIYYLASGFNTYSFLRLGIGVKLFKEKKDYDVGFDWEVVKNYSLSLALLNGDGTVLPRQYSTTFGYKSDDGDKCLALNSDLSGNVKFGFERQITEKAFWRIGYDADHPTIGCTLPLHQNIDIDLAADLGKDNARILAGIELFRNTENKRVNSNHNINFGKAVTGEDQFINVDGFNIHYVDAGSGPTLVLIGGGIHYTHHWDPYMKEFAKNYRVINIDQLGAGESDKPNYFFGYTIEEQGELINALLDKIGVKEAYLLGYCYGGSIAFYLAGHYPEKYKKLIVIEGFVRGINTIPIAGEGRAEAGKMRHDVEYLNAYLMRDFVVFSYRLNYPYFNGKMWYQLNKSILYIDLRDEIRNMNAPVLYFAGTNSWAKDFLGPTKDYIKENLKNLTYVEITGAGHDVDRYDENKFLKEAVKYLKEP
jgi:pimeloyl-ACP methyl ester carboxylesterase